MFKHHTLVLSLKFWLATVFIGPVAFMISVWIEEHSIGNAGSDVTGLLMMWAVGIFFSFPAWLALFLLMTIIEKILSTDRQKKIAWLLFGIVIVLVTFYFMAGSHEPDRLWDLLIDIVIYYIIVFCASIFFFTRQIKSQD